MLSKSILKYLSVHIGFHGSSYELRKLHKEQKLVTNIHSFYTISENKCIEMLLMFSVTTV